MQTNTYLFFDGRCEEALKFYAQCLNGKIEFMMPYAGSPAESHTPKEFHSKIMHACMKMGDNQLMASDDPAYKQAQGFCVNINVNTTVDAERIFRELAEGGSIKMPIGETFWALRFGMLTDRFGTPWMINCPKPM